MRLSILALFIALPAAAYAAVTPRQGTGTQCGPPSTPCTVNSDCCSGACGPFRLLRLRRRTQSKQEKGGSKSRLCWVHIPRPSLLLYSPLCHVVVVL
ncbi:hypothetical protein DFH94DRAFT_775653 [Russula ochroleuca]|uniref:Uncharacterized protein n=1 Tax=Russula ochroleuca TaxID=152965 RepID=A0A9P5JYD7_9AGAM|nr:hypothetical protein DFH94DRAFT_775653 [Russula ochroleuca]